MSSADAKPTTVPIVEQNKTIADFAEDDVMKVVDDAIEDWYADYEFADLPDPLMSANALEPIFATLRHQEFEGSIVVYFRCGRPLHIIARNAQDSFEELGGGMSQLKR